MTNRDEVAKRVAERLGFNQFAELLTEKDCWSGRMWDALISSEMRLAEAQDAFLDREEDFEALQDDLKKAEMRVGELQEALREIEVRTRPNGERFEEWLASKPPSYASHYKIAMESWLAALSVKGRSKPQTNCLACDAPTEMALCDACFAKAEADRKP